MRRSLMATRASRLAISPPGPEGNLFHRVSEIDGVIRITDVWQDRETFDDFAEHQIKPYTAKVGVAAPATVTYYDLHNYFTAGA